MQRMMLFINVIFIVFSITISEAAKPGKIKKSKDKGCLQSDILAIKTDVTGFKADLSDLREKMDGLEKGMAEILQFIKKETIQVRQGKWEWGDWSPCDNTTCIIAFRQRLCIGENRERMELSQCKTRGDINFQTKQCCKELQDIDKGEFYETLYGKNKKKLPDAYIKASRSNIKIREREKLSWIVSLKFQTGSGKGDWQHICGGVILSDLWLATAAHCICDAGGSECCTKGNLVSCNVNQWKIIAGEWRLTETSKTMEESREVDHIIVHEDYVNDGKNELFNDIALIKLKTRLEFMDNPHIQSSLLPARTCVKFIEGKCSSHNELAVYSGCNTTGWGMKESGGVSIKARTINVWVQNALNVNTSIFETQSIDTERALCEGFSGSPLMCDFNTTGMEFIPPQDMVVLGLNSFIQVGGCERIDKNNYTHTSLVYHMEWISNKVQEWTGWGKWSKCYKDMRYRLKSGFFPEYGYLPGSGPLYQTFNGDRFKRDSESCRVSGPDCYGLLDGVRKITTENGATFRALCKDNWLHLAHRFNGDVDFDKTWSEYKSGFGLPNREHFLGFDNALSVLDQGSYRLRIELTTWKDDTRYAEYGKFNLSDEEDFYRLTIGEYEGTAGDSLIYQNNQRFSTKDQDHDGHPRPSFDCAKRHKGPFWYHGCADSALFGVYKDGGQCESYATCVLWRLWPKVIGNATNNWYSFKVVRMMIQPT